MLQEGVIGIRAVKVLKVEGENKLKPLLLNTKKLRNYNKPTTCWSDRSPVLLLGMEN
jgi:hypothetical protein